MKISMQKLATILQSLCIPNLSGDEIDDFERLNCGGEEIDVSKLKLLIATRRVWEYSAISESIYTLMKEYEPYFDKEQQILSISSYQHTKAILDNTSTVTGSMQCTTYHIDIICDGIITKLFKIDIDEGEYDYIKSNTVLCEGKNVPRIIYDITAHINRERFDDISTTINSSLWPFRQFLYNILDRYGFFDKPASRKHHGNKIGGLFEHSLSMYYALSCNFSGIKWEDGRSPFIISMCHDLCKCDNYKYRCNLLFEEDLADGRENRLYYFDFTDNDSEIYSGHAEKSLSMLSMSSLDLTYEEAMCVLYHMGPYAKLPLTTEGYGKQVEKNENVLWTHTADMYSARVDWDGNNYKSTLED